MRETAFGYDGGEREIPARHAVEQLTTEELYQGFLVSELFEPGRGKLTGSGLDGMVIGSAMPDAPLRLEESFLEGRELGILNLGESGAVVVGGERYSLERLDCLYAGLGERDAVFERGAGTPKFYLAACPADKKHPTTKLAHGGERRMAIGEAGRASVREIHQYICPGMVESCQLVMGFTELAPGSIWNTMPAHTHIRRSEIYLYFDLDGIVVHLMGEPERTRHLIVKNEQAVLSPRWSIHSGAGTSNYRFAWAMAGDNQEFGDIDPLTYEQLK